MDPSMSSDSRKRPLDGEFESGVSKRSNQGTGAAVNSVHFKVLIPSIAAGAIIGKGGETITQIQKDSGASIKMSKANDFYPATTERVCLITGTLDGVRKVHGFIMDRIREKPDPNPKPMDGDIKVNLERHKQVKILVPNSTAGMVIGKAGNYIQQIKKETGAYVQISQKSKDLNLPERCVTIAGSDQEQNKKAVDMILQKIIEDPQSASCPNISYADIHGPIASANPTGSPYAANTGPGGQVLGPNMGPQGYGPGMGNGGINSNITGMNNLNINNARDGRGGNGGPNQMENLKVTLRVGGYSEIAIEEISAAMLTLANYGLLGVGPGMGNSGGVSLGGTTGLGPLNLGQSLSNLSNLFSGGGGGQGPMMGTPNGASGNMGSVFGPVGSTPTSLGGNSPGSESLFANEASGHMAHPNQYPNPNDVFNEGYNSPTEHYSGPNQNSFGIGMNNYGGDDKGIKKELEVPENIVGAILGPGGKGIVELQQHTGANIQISKKGVYAPGTRNRVVTISGSPGSVNRAQYLIQQRISQEENKRAHQAANH